jgi:beta-xylosidase
MTMIHNPILPGFNPDPSICRAGDDYYIATSTFEWYPGVQIHHSRDLVNWCLVTRALDRAAQLDMRGDPDSGGVWAPCLSHADGARPGHLRLIARESIGSWFEQALVARRQEHFSYRAETELDFRPQNFQQAAGITAYYNRHKFHFLAVTFSDTLGRVLTILSCDADYPVGNLSFPLAEPVRLDSDGPVRLAVAVERETLQFSFVQGDAWRNVGPVLDASILSDEAGCGEHGSFTGAFVGMAAFDTSGSAIPADYGYFLYEGVD